MNLGTETDSFVNHVMAGGTRPQVGMGATILMWADRTPGTIVKITPTQIHVQEDDYTRTDNNGMSESQAYEYRRNPGNIIRVFRRTKHGYRCKGMGLHIGNRERYYDFSF